MLYVIQSYDRFQIQISKICAGCPYPAKVGPLETDFTEIGLALLRLAGGINQLKELRLSRSASVHVFK